MQNKAIHHITKLKSDKATCWREYETSNCKLLWEPSWQNLVKLNFCVFLNIIVIFPLRNLSRKILKMCTRRYV